MSYTAKPPFNVPPGAPNQSQQAASGARDPAAQINLGAQNPSAPVQNVPSMATNASAANNLLAPTRQYFPTHQQQQLMQQQMFLQTLQQQQQQHHSGQQVNAASIQRMVTDYQKSLSSAVQSPNGNLNAAAALSTTQQIQQLVQLTTTQPTTNLLNLLQHAQAQVQQQQQQQHQKAFPQPLPSNTTITPVSSRQQSYLPTAGAANQQKSAPSYSTAKPPQSKQSQAAQARRNTANLPKSRPPAMLMMSSQANLKATTASNYTAAKLAPNVAASHYGGIANVKTANVPPPLPNVSISKVQVATGDSGGGSKASSNVAVPVNASIKSDALSPLKPNVSVALPVVASPPKLLIPPKLEKISPKANAPLSPRTKQTPRKNSNPIKTTPPSTVAIAQSNNLVSKKDLVAAFSKTPTAAAPTVTIQQQQSPQQPQPKENSPKTAPAVAQVIAAEKLATAKPQPVPAPAPATAAANNTPTKSNDAVNANIAVTAVQSSPLPPKPATAATPKAAQSVATTKASASTAAKLEKKPSAAATSAPKTATPSSVDQKVKRNRLRTIPYQSPIPELELISKLTASEANNSSKNSEDKLIIFYKNEFLALRNDEGGFFLCQAIQNVYKSSPRIRIRWLSEEKQNQSVYGLDFYDHTDIECVLTTVSLEKQAKGKFELTKGERERVQNILQKALNVEKGVAPRPDVTEENPDGLDLSLYKNESQIEKKTPTKRRASESKSTKTTASAKQKKAQKAIASDDDDNYEPSKKRKKTPIKSSAKKKAPKSAAKKQAPSPQAAPLQKEATKTEIKATKDDKEVASTPKTAKAPVKRKLIETVAAVAAPDAKPTEVDKEKLKSDKEEASAEQSSPSKVAKVAKSSEKSATTSSPTGVGRTTRRSRV